MDAEPAYVIGVVSRMLEMHPQTLRKYERAGLIRPSRTDGMLRLYSDADLRRLRLIKHLVDDVGLNIAGVELVLRMRDHVNGLRSRFADGSASVLDLLDRELDEILTTQTEHEETL